MTRHHEIGILPHWNDKYLAERYGGHIIDITSGFYNVLYEIASCKRILTSSLHGVIAADALGIPRLWHHSDKNPGGGFKFRDYQSVLGEIVDQDIWYEADKDRVEQVCQSLLAGLEEVKKLL
jgi:hypothetical protein